MPSWLAMKPPEDRPDTVVLLASTLYWGRATAACLRLTRVAPPRETRTVTVDGDLYGLEADAFAASVLDGVPPAVSREDTLGNQRVVDEMRRQVR